MEKLYIFKNVTDKKYWLPGMTGISCIISAASVLISLVIFLGLYNVVNSLYLAIVLVFVNVVLIGIQMRNDHGENMIDFTKYYLRYRKGQKKYMYRKKQFLSEDQ